MLDSIAGDVTDLDTQEFARREYELGSPQPAYPEIEGIGQACGVQRVQQMDGPASVGIRDDSNQQRPCSYPVVARAESVTKTSHLPPNLYVYRC